MIRLRRAPRLVRLTARGESVCPLSKTVDVFEVTLEFVPRGATLAIEEFRRMVEGYRGVEILHEELAVDLMEKVRAAIDPAYVKVTLRSAYMGVGVEVVAESGGSPSLYI